MKQIRIGYDQEAKRVGDINRRKKASYLLELQEFFNHFDLTFKEESTNYVQCFQEQFQERHSDSFPQFVSLEKMLELSEVRFDVLTALEQHYRQTPFVPEDVDYNIYTSNQRQIDAYNLALRTLDIINELGEIYTPINNKLFNELSVNFRGIVTIDKHTSKRSVNVARIKAL